MPLQNMVAIQTVTVGAGGASSIDFTNIPQTYTDLQIVLSGRQSVAGGTNVNMKFNGSSSGYTNRDIISAAGTVVSESSVLGTSSIKIGFIPENVNYTASTFSNQYVYIPNYAGSNNKSVSTDNAMENNSTSVYFGLFAGLWSNSSAITSIALTCESGNFVQYSTATLYGVSNTIASGAKAYGGMVTSDDNYFYHTFLASGTFTPTANITADYLVVAGGGGGGHFYYGGGGGAGGLRCTVTATGGGGALESALSLTASTNYTVTVGGGGAGSSTQSNGTNGSNSVFSSITSTGGGGGGYAANGGGAVGGSSGGSGGGGDGNGSGSGTTWGTGGARTVGQGYAGGNGWSQSGGSGAGAGGGGAGAAGGNGAYRVGGNGGNGVTTSISGSSVTYAGGGGGAGFIYTAGSGGTGGGGYGRNESAVANTGGGGGGDGNGGIPAGNGGSGIVIIRYAK